MSLATIEERDAILAKQHSVFREVDAAFHAYLETVVANPDWKDGRIEEDLMRRGVHAMLAEGVVVHGPLAWGREIVEQLGVQCSPACVLRSLADGHEQEVLLAHVMEYAWARAMIGLYRTRERNEIFKQVACRSAELDAVNNALNGGASPEDMRGGKMASPIVTVRRPLG